VVTTFRDPAHDLLDADDSEQVRAALHAVSGRVIEDLGGSLDEALHGSEEATRRYVELYRLLTATLLAEAHKARPDAIVATDEQLLIADAKGRPLRVLVDALENASAEAPFTPWTARFELGDAVALDLTNRLRTYVGADMLAVPVARPEVPLDDVGAERFLRRVRHFLDDPEDRNPLERLMGVFALSKTELAGLFGVKRQAVDGWLKSRVPAERQEKLATLLSLADLLQRKLKAGRVPGVARRRADAYGGKTMLELIAADRHRELLELVRDSFDWSRPA
jgi:hypothetical protein